MYCTCGQCLIDKESKRKFNKLRLDALSIPNYVIKKGPHSWCSTWQDRKYKKSTIWLGMRGRDAVRKSTLKVNFLQLFTIDFSEIQFIVNHTSQSEWTEQQCKEWDELAKEDHTYHLTPEEKKRYQGQWYLTLNKAGKNGRMKLRSDFRAAVSMNNRPHHESGEQVEDRLHQINKGRWHSSSSASWCGTSLDGIESELIFLN